MTIITAAVTRRRLSGGADDRAPSAQSSSGVPIYLQLMEQVKHAIETGALRPGEQLLRASAAGQKSS